MHDKEIRKILIEYLKIKNKKYRIFQEKSIGNVICDVMLVTNELVGFEIKSDYDNFERLTNQVNEYDKFFNRNYLVVGETHEKNAINKTPHSWGLLIVSDDGIKEVRKAKNNKFVDFQRQLNILWKIELKNLLLKNNLPLYPQKPKDFLRKTLSEKIASDILSQQIAEELLRRDYSLFDYNDDTIQSNSNTDFDYNNTENFIPVSELVDRLSEENLSSFTLDKWMSIYRMAVEKQNIKDEIAESMNTVNQRQRKNAHKIPYTDIRISLGVPWISDEIVSQFATEVLKVKPEYYYQYDKSSGKQIPYKRIPIVRHEKITGHWHVEKYKNHTNPELISIYGTARFNAMQILEAMLNLREIKIYDGIIYNETETIAAIEKQKVLQSAFEQWIWQSDDRRWEIEELYNNMFGEYEEISYDGSDIFFSDMNSEIKLYDYQKNAIKRIVSTPNTMLSFDVGSGKTYIMIAAAMEMRKNGLSRKNMFVVPNNIVGQWEKMFLDLYPDAKVLAIEPKSFLPDKRKKVLEQIQKEDYDGIIIAYSCFEMIPLSSKYLFNDMHNTLSRFETRLKEIYKEGFSSASTSIKHEIGYIKKTVEDFISSVVLSDIDITFDKLDINTLFVDEAHNFKNIPLRTNLKRIRGINTKGSKKCLDMLNKVHYIQKSNDGRGVVFATGTPLCNSISDVYAMQCYLQYNELIKNGLERFDNWVKTFARTEEVCEIDVDASKFRIVVRFKEFFNLRELSKMIGQFSIYHSNDKCGLPSFYGYTDILLKNSDCMKNYMSELLERTEKIRSGNIDRKKDNMLKVSTDGRKAALSLFLVGREQSYDSSSKVFMCVKNVLKIYHSNKENSQLIFCDYSVPKSTEYSVYKELKERLTEQGIPQKEIAFIHSYTNEQQKLKLYRDFNNGVIRILIGSTFKLGIGANVQTNLKAIHHLDIPWRPADMVQREGRILRHGNKNNEINIFRYITEGSFDSYSWQILQTKQHFISQFLSGTNSIKSIKDFDNDELNYAQVKALALSEPLMKDYVSKENELRNARIILHQEYEQKEAAKNTLAETNYCLENLRRKLINTLNNARYIQNNIDCICEHAQHFTINKSDFPIQKIGEFKISFQNNKLMFLNRLDEEYQLELGNSDRGNKIRVKNFFLEFYKQVDITTKEISALEERKNNLNQQLLYSSDIQQRVIRLEKELSDIFERISIQS